ncbi:MAG TPA: glycosyltransferase family 4 protein [Frankiaceae bacterium]|nr:glycosyltransferase family 4 protein [Frankiaceae bacterium]
MRVLVVHNRYVSAVPSGENAVVDEEVAALREAGVDVVTHLRSSDEIAGLSPALAVRPVYSRVDAREVAAKLDGVDVLHLHNPYPLVSPWVVRVAKRAGVPVVQTVHNYRHGCVAGSHYRDARVCEDCLPTRTRWPGVVHGCYRGSRAQSLALTTAELLHTGTWNSVDRYLALTSFAKRKLVEAGLPESRIVVRPNSTPDPGPSSPPGEGLLFVGRLDEEKGAPLLYSAWSPEVPLTVIGAGRFEPPPGIRYLGPQPADVVAAEMERCAAVVVPSVVYEGFPRVVVEAFARGRPVLATSVGPLPDLVTAERGWLAPPTPEGLRDAMAHVSADPSRGAAARAHYLAELTPERTMRSLLAVYDSVVG